MRQKRACPTRHGQDWADGADKRARITAKSATLARRWAAWCGRMLVKGPLNGRCPLKISFAFWMRLFNRVWAISQDHAPIDVGDEDPQNLLPETNHELQRPQDQLRFLTETHW